MASASASAAAPAPPAFLATMFAGAPDAGVKMGQSRPFGRLTLGIPEGWMLNNSWDSVDHVTKKDSSAGVVILRLDLSEGLLDANIATWVKVPFSTSEVKWEPRESGKAGAAQLDAKVAKGAGKIGKDDAQFWQVATAVEKNKYGLVLVAGLKKSADDKTRAELMACVRSAAWKWLSCGQCAQPMLPPPAARRRANSAVEPSKIQFSPANHGWPVAGKRRAMSSEL